MNRKYARVEIEMIVEGNVTEDQLRDELFNFLFNSPTIDAGEINIEPSLHGDVVINENGYVVPWPKD